MLASKRLLHFVLSVVLVGLFGTTTALAQPKKPNILAIWGDDIGTRSISHNNRGMMGFR